jgi:hypothetical protein
MARWRYPARAGLAGLQEAWSRYRGGRPRGLLDRVLLQPVPRTVHDRFADRVRLPAKRLHEEFWLTREGHPE